MAEAILEGAHPTRMELLHVRNRLRLATKGHRLLKEKRDTLILEFMRLAKEASATEEAAQAQMKKAITAYALSAAEAGQASLSSVAFATAAGQEAEIEYRNVMGIRLPAVAAAKAGRRTDERGIGLIATHPSIDAAASEYESAITQLVKLAVQEESITDLSDEVKRTRRRVNALEYTMIPRLKNTQKYILMRLEEFEREGFYRRKMIRRKRKT